MCLNEKNNKRLNINKILTETRVYLHSTLPFNYYLHPLYPGSAINLSSFANRISKTFLTHYPSLWEFLTRVTDRYSLQKANFHVSEASSIQPHGARHAVFFRRWGKNHYKTRVKCTWGTLLARSPTNEFADRVCRNDCTFFHYSTIFRSLNNQNLIRRRLQTKESSHLRTEAINLRRTFRNSIPRLASAKFCLSFQRHCGEFKLVDELWMWEALIVWTSKSCNG